MNRFVANGLLDEMRTGKRIVVLSPRPRFQVFGEIVQHIPYAANDVKVRRASDCGRISSTLGGSIEFAAVNELHRLRGVTVDLVYIDGPERLLTDSQMQSIAPIVMASHRGEIVHA